MQPATRHAGTLAPLVAIGGILLASGLDPTFSWTHDALSHLGVRSRSRFVFNGGLILGGSLACVHAVGLWRIASGREARLVASVFAIAAMLLVGVGAFPLGHPFHVPVALGFYVGITIVFLGDGIVRRSPWAIGLAVVHVAIWTVWALGVLPGQGLAIPELAGALLVPVWIWWTGPAATGRGIQSIAT